MKSKPQTRQTTQANMPKEPLVKPSHVRFDPKT